ncbi:hypothetical protein G6F29_013869 [Rhizopus arrhizus]|nr:hypothetical protein G6F30_013467 [Rhizopus arrhizus]KAG0971834.1 hypothetical protein G6F29_013869 [Rhizopus arrhizus]KAG0972816.1 hypothetical protein G6F28_013833 [Rhizopus arrhizus]KAG1000812.1 hypothetical protein G6F27_013462 [Rhizopus arrhizus]KAG1007558.1 hypothetical protein G6F26_013813 [Rhizopus arrhizus]
MEPAYAAEKRPHTSSANERKTRSGKKVKQNPPESMEIDIQAQPAQSSRKVTQAKSVRNPRTDINEKPVNEKPVTTRPTVADKTGAQKLKSTLYLRHMSATFVAYTI